MANNRDIERFMTKVAKSSTGCWEWLAGKKGGGYGAFYLNGKLRGAHRASLFLFSGFDLSTRLDCMHSCDNPACVNPGHLSYGTRTQNMMDASAKGRIVNVQDWRGVLNPKSKLSADQIQEIVNAVNAGATRNEAAITFGVSNVRICQILKAAGQSSTLTASEAATQKRLARTNCRKGHALSGLNLRINSAGARVCLQCEKDNAIARRLKKVKGQWHTEKF